MKKQELLKEIDVEWLKEAYFSEAERHIQLEAGAILLRPGDRNERLFLILEGALTGYIENEGGSHFEIFRSGKDQFVGVYSYFSRSHQSYSTVVAEKDSTLAYIESDQKVMQDEEGRTFAEHFLPVVINEIYMRQLAAQRMSIQSQGAMKRLYEAEKMATLGQMAAGLAHELNNAVSVIHRKAEWIAERAAEYIQSRETEGWYPFFEMGLSKGSSLSAADVRKRKKELQDRFGLKGAEARQLASTGLDDEALQPYLEDLNHNLPQINYYYETGQALHDMLLAARHAANVVRSVKELAVTDHQIRLETNVNQSLSEAVSLLKDMLRKVDLQLDLTELPALKTNPGELVQVWVNLIKNACESLVSSSVAKPAIHISSRMKDHHIEIRITDNGPGIPPELLPRIFQPNVTTKIKGLSFGLGLGLSIVQKIIEGYNGQISVESRPGKTTFTIQLPLE